MVRKKKIVIPVKKMKKIHSFEKTRTVTSGVVADRTEGVDGGSNGQPAEDPKSGDSHAVEVGELARHEDGHRESERRDDHGLVAERQPVDDDGGGTGIRRLRHFLYGSAKHLRKKKLKKSFLFIIH